LFTPVVLQMYPIWKRYEDRPQSLIKRELEDGATYRWPERIFWPSGYFVDTSDTLHWLQALGCAVDPYDGALAHDSGPGGTGVSTGMLALSSPHACAMLASFSGFSGLCVGRDGRCHTQQAFFDMLARVGGASTGDADVSQRGCTMRAGGLSGGEGAMVCYQLLSNPCLRFDHAKPSPCSPQASCVWDGPGTDSRCECNAGFVGNGEQCVALVDERQCDGPGSVWEDGQCFKRLGSYWNFVTAQSKCISWGGALASIRSEAQTLAVVELLGGARAWIGLRQAAYNQESGTVFAPAWMAEALEQQTEGNLRAGATVGDSYLNWASGEQATFGNARSLYNGCQGSTRSSTPPAAATEDLSDSRWPLDGRPLPSRFRAIA